MMLVHQYTMAGLKTFDEFPELYNEVLFVKTVSVLMYVGFGGVMAYLNRNQDPFPNYKYRNISSAMFVIHFVMLSIMIYCSNLAIVGLTSTEDGVRITRYVRVYDRKIIRTVRLKRS